MTRIHIVAKHSYFLRIPLVKRNVISLEWLSDLLQSEHHCKKKKNTILIIEALKCLISQEQLVNTHFSQKDPTN